MTSTLKLRIALRLVAVGIAFSAAAVQAAKGITVDRGQQLAVKVGMTTSEVRQILGRPANIFTYRNARGPSWVYDGVNGATVFDIDFGSDGRVVAVGERVILRG